jgi:putative endonuclease
MFYTYVLKSLKNASLYTGYTNDLRKRIKEHNDGLSGFTKKYLPYELIYYEACLNQSDAKARETQLKTGLGKKYLKARLKRYLRTDKLDMDPV